MSSKASLDDKVQSCLKNKQTKKEKQHQRPKRKTLGIFTPRRKPRAKEGLPFGRRAGRTFSAGVAACDHEAQLSSSLGSVVHLSCSSIPELGPPCPLVSSALGKTASVLDSQHTDLTRTDCSRTKQVGAL